MSIGGAPTALEPSTRNPCGMKRGDSVLSHWYVLFDDFAASGFAFFDTVEANVREREVPGVTFARKDFRESASAPPRGSTSHPPLQPYLRHRRCTLRHRLLLAVVDSCGAALSYALPPAATTPVRAHHRHPSPRYRQRKYSWICNDRLQPKIRSHRRIGLRSVTW